MCLRSHSCDCAGQTLGPHLRMRPTTQALFSLKLCEKCRFNSCVRVFFIPRGSRGLKQWVVTSISHMGQMRDSDWSRRNLLRCDWLPTRVALMTTTGDVMKLAQCFRSYVRSATSYIHRIIQRHVGSIDVRNSVRILFYSSHFRNTNTFGYV